MKNIISIGIAEDHIMFRQGLVSLLKPYKNFEVIFDVGNGVLLLEALKQRRPDILLLDIEMPIMRAPDVLEKIKNKYPRVKVIIVSAYFQKEYIVECFRLGVKAFLDKGEKIERVVDAILSVHEKGIYSDDTVTKVLADEIYFTGTLAKIKKRIFTEAEKQVLKEVIKGTSRKTIAEKLGVKPETVNFHVSNMRRKTDTANTSALISHVIQNNLLPDV